MKIGFVGLGKLGLPCALAAEAKGHEVLGTDPLWALCPIRDGIPKPDQFLKHEKGAAALLATSKLRVVELPELVAYSELIFVAVQTPHEAAYEGSWPMPEERKDFNYDFLVQAVRNIVAVDPNKTIVIISTVLPGTLRRHILPIVPETTKIVYNPYFIAMGTVIDDYYNPEFVLLGNADYNAGARVVDFYRTTLKDPKIVWTTIENAELIKVAYNTFIGLKLAFVNTLMEICHKIPHANVDTVTDALKLATKRLISPAYMSAGMGDGCGCHPRDQIALSWLAKELDLSFDIFGMTIQAREAQTAWLADLVIKQHRLTGLPIFILGQACKAESAQTVGSPARLLVHFITKRGYTCKVFDPFTTSPIESVKGVYFVATKHDAFRKFSFPEGSTIIDPWRYIESAYSCKHIEVGC